MTPAEHRAAAEELIEHFERGTYTFDKQGRAEILMKAQVHATLALYPPEVMFKPTGLVTTPAKEGGE